MIIMPKVFTIEDVDSVVQKYKIEQKFKKFIIFQDKLLFGNVSQHCELLMETGQKIFYDFEFDGGGWFYVRNKTINVFGESMFFGGFNPRKLKGAKRNKYQNQYINIISHPSYEDRVMAMRS